MTAVFIPAPAAAQQVRFYPSAQCPSNGNHGLNDCIAAAHSGDFIELVSSNLSTENATIEKSITILPQSGLQTPRLRSLTIDDAGGIAPLTVTIENVSLSVSLHVTLANGDGSSITAQDVTVDTTSSLDFPISVNASRSASVELIRPRVSFSGNGVDGISVTSSASAVLTLTIVGASVISDPGSTTGPGADIDSTQTSTIRATVDNSLFANSQGCACGSGGALVFRAEDSSHLVANVAGDTIDGAGADAAPGHHENALFLLDQLAEGGSMTVRAFNSIFSRAGGDGVNLDTESAQVQPTVVLGFNDFWKLGHDQEGLASEGKHNLHTNPRFVDASSGDFRLAAGSPVINAGQVCSPAGVADPDAADHHRLAGPSVDLGAFERGAGAPTGIVRVGKGTVDSLLGTTGDDILCGYGGADTLKGIGGSDFLDGGDGKDLIVGGAGVDRLLGGSGDDTLCGADGASGDVVDGGPGTDAFTADRGDVRSSVETHLGACP